MFNRNFLLMLFTFLFAIQLSSQDFGIRFGFNLANVTGEEVEDNSIRPGLQIGPVLDHHFNNLLTLHTGVIFSMKGANFTINNESENLASNFIDIPVLLRFNDKSGLYFESGIQLGFLVAATYDGDDVSDFYNDTDYQAVLGLGYSMNKIRFDFRYNFSMGSVISNPYSTDVSLKNHVMAICASYTL